MEKLSKLCSLINFIQSEIHDIHLLAAGHDFFRLHELSGEYYNKLLDFYDDLVEQALILKLKINPTVDSNKFVDLASNLTERTLSEGYSRIFQLFINLESELKYFYDNEPSVKDNVSLRVALENILSWIQKETHYKLSQALSLIKASDVTFSKNFSAKYRAIIYKKLKTGDVSKIFEYGVDDTIEAFKGRIINKKYESDEYVNQNNTWDSILFFELVDNKWINR